MAIQNIKSILDLEIFSLAKVYKHCREIIGPNLFCNLLVASMEHLLVYLKGKNIEEFYNNIINSIPETKTDSYQGKNRDLLEDLSDLFEKKQIKILSSLIYDFSFINFLLFLQEKYEVPDSKTSENESLYEIQCYSQKMNINVLVLSKDLEETKFCNENPFVSITVLQINQQNFILFPYKYKSITRNEVFLKEEVSNFEDMRKNNIEIELKNEVLTEQSDVNNKTQTDGNFGTSPSNSKKTSEDLAKKREKEVENRMRQRSKALKAKRKQAAEEKRLEDLKQKELEEKAEEAKSLEMKRIIEENKILREKELEKLKQAEEEIRMLKE